MKIITQSAEYHFLSVLEEYKERPENRAVLSLSGLRGFDHQAIMKDPAAIADRLQDMDKKGKAAFADIQNICKPFENVQLYQFTAYDICAVFQLQSAEDKTKFGEIFKKCSQDKRFSECKTYFPATEWRALEKVIDRVFSAEKLIKVYQGMADAGKIKSIPFRRERNEHPKVLLVEDDRFTATYTANILNKEYDLCIARSGEEGLLAYIEHAPDIVFLDIHLPGLCGHETLRTIYAMDPTAYVVMLSVDTVKENITQASRDGARLFLKKPFSRERLEKTVLKSPHVKTNRMQAFLSESSSLH